MCVCMYNSWSLNNLGLSFVHPLIGISFSVSMYYLHSLRLTDCADIKLQIWRANCKIIQQFWLQEGLVFLTPVQWVKFKGQLYICVRVCTYVCVCAFIYSVLVFLILSCVSHFTDIFSPLAVCWFCKSRTWISTMSGSLLSLAQIVSRILLSCQ